MRATIVPLHPIEVFALAPRDGDRLACGLRLVELAGGVVFANRIAALVERHFGTRWAKALAQAEVERLPLTAPCPEWDDTPEQRWRIGPVEMRGSDRWALEIGASEVHQVALRIASEFIDLADDLFELADFAFDHLFTSQVFTEGAI